MEILNYAHSYDFETDPAWWESFLKRTLRLPLVCYFAVREILADGAWRSKDSPVGYVKTAAERKARNAGWLEDETDDPQPLRGLPGADKRKGKGQWDRRISLERLAEGGEEEAGKDVPLRQNFGDAEVSLLTGESHPVTGLARQIDLDWRVIGGRAGLDAEATKYLLDRAAGVRTQPSEATRKSLQRAYPRLREAIEWYLAQWQAARSFTDGEKRIADLLRDRMRSVRRMLERERDMCEDGEFQQFLESHNTFQGVIDMRVPTYPRIWDIRAEMESGGALRVWAELAAEVITKRIAA